MYTLLEKNWSLVGQAEVWLWSNLHLNIFKLNKWSETYYANGDFPVLLTSHTCRWNQICCLMRLQFIYFINSWCFMPITPTLILYTCMWICVMFPYMFGIMFRFDLVASLLAKMFLPGTRMPFENGSKLYVILMWPLLHSAKEKAPSLHLMAVIFLCGIIMVKGLKLEEVSRDADGVRFFVGLSGVAMPTNNRLMNQFLIVLEFAGLVTVFSVKRRRISGVGKVSYLAFLKWRHVLCRVQSCIKRHCMT